MARITKMATPAMMLIVRRVKRNLIKTSIMLVPHMRNYVHERTTLFYSTGTTLLNASLIEPLQMRKTVNIAVHSDEGQVGKRIM
jgi:hypothetical protein